MHPQTVVRSLAPVAAAMAAMLCGAEPAQAQTQIVYTTGGFSQGPFGAIGFDVFAQQSVGIRFTPADDFRFAGADVWIMSNDFSGPSGVPVKVTLRTDATTPQGSVPGEAILETLSFSVSAVGWQPVIETVTSATSPLLRQGRNYWLVLECTVPSENPVWHWASDTTGFMSTNFGGPANWQAGGMGACGATTIEGTATCPADCDQSGSLNVFDYICFGNAYALQHPDADCTGDNQFNVFDYICFGNAYSNGCP